MLSTGHFNNVGSNGLGVYDGASDLTELAADLLVISGGNHGSSTNIGINLPAGLLLQPDPHLALTLQAGYSAVIQTAGGTTAARHLIPLALEAVVSPVPLLDVGGRFSLDGSVGQSGGGSAPGYFDQRALMIWIRFHA